jgi:hypothetical protein
MIAKHGHLVSIRIVHLIQFILCLVHLLNALENLVPSKIMVVSMRFERMLLGLVLLDLQIRELIRFHLLYAQFSVSFILAEDTDLVLETFAHLEENFILADEIVEVVDTGVSLCQLRYCHSLGAFVNNHYWISK